MYGFPVTTENGEYKMRRRAWKSTRSRARRMDATLKELQEERDGVASLCSSHGAAAEQSMTAVPAPQRRSARHGTERALSRAAAVRSLRRQRAATLSQGARSCRRDWARCSTSPAIARTVRRSARNGARQGDGRADRRRGQRASAASARASTTSRHHAWRSDLDILVGDAGARIAFVTLPKAESAATCSASCTRCARNRARGRASRTIPVSVHDRDARRACTKRGRSPRCRASMSLDFGTMDFVSAHHGAIPSSAMQSPGQFDHPLAAAREVRSRGGGARARGRARARRDARARRHRDVVARRRAARAKRIRLPAHVEHPSGADRADRARVPARCRRSRRPRRRCSPRRRPPIGARSATRTSSTIARRTGTCWDVLQRAHAAGVAIPAAAAAFFARRRNVVGAARVERQVMTRSRQAQAFAPPSPRRTPLQVVGAINAYHALLAERSRLPGDLSFGRRRRRRLARRARPRHQHARRRAHRRAPHHRRLRPAAAGRRRHRLRRVRLQHRAHGASLIKVGAAAMHIEDQVGAKRCGHRPGKEIVPQGGDGRSHQGRRRRAHRSGLRHHGAHRRARGRRAGRRDRPRRGLRRSRRRHDLSRSDHRARACTAHSRTR